MFGRRTLLATGAILAPRVVRAQSWQPTRPVRLITPYGPGNVADQVARILAEDLSRRWGQRVVVDNQPGAGGALGVAQIARAAPDGTTLGFIAVAALTIIPHMMRQKLYDPLEDILPIGGVSVSRSALAIHPSLPVRSLAELAAYARSRPTSDPLAYCTAGNGTVPHLNIEQLRRALGFPALHVPYRTAGAAVADLLAGRVQISMDAASVTLPHLERGSLRGLAWNGPRRNPSIPDVPTLEEAAPGLSLMNAWQGLYGPRGLPAEIVERAAEDVAAVLAAPGFAARMPGGAEPFPGGPTELRALLRTQHAELGRLVAEIGLEQGLMAFRAHRVGLLIRPHMDARMGANVQGPSLIRVPDWLPDPLGRYYLYFADHKGDYIRLAVADAIEGPWRMHAPGSLQLADSLYPTAPPPVGEVAPADRLAGVAPAGTPGIPPPEQDARWPHIASPDVHVDHANRRIVMYYHGLVAYRTQRTRVAVSADGVRFEARPELLGPSYFRVFAHRGATYALAMPGLLFRSADGFSGFARGPVLFAGGLQRHTAVLVRGDTLHVFWTRVGDIPERILHSRVRLAGDWHGWTAEGEDEVLRPVAAHEGGELPLMRSWRGAVNLPVRQLRDPCVFEEDGRVWLLYAVQGEAGIALAELEADHLTP